MLIVSDSDEEYSKKLAVYKTVYVQAVDIF
jgi:hypothetical protein